jgi:hypothetical protein
MRCMNHGTPPKSFSPIAIEKFVIPALVSEHSAYLVPWIINIEVYDICIGV